MAPVESLHGVRSSSTSWCVRGSDADAIRVLRGEHDSSTVPALAVLLAAAMARDGSRLVLDLSGVQFMDAATVGVISAPAILAASDRGP